MSLATEIVPREAADESPAICCAHEGVAVTARLS